MLVGVIAGSFNFNREDMKQLRAQSVKNVKATNGRISLEKRTQQTDEYIIFLLLLHCFSMHSLQ